MPSYEAMKCFHQTHRHFLSGPEKGIERIQVLFLVVALIAAGSLLMPSLTKKYHAEKDLKMKVLLRAFHSANQAYRANNPDEGYAKEILSLVHNAKRRRFLGETWLKPKLEGYSMVYQAPELFPRTTFSLSARRESLYPSFYCIDQHGILHSGMAVKAEEPLKADDAGCHGGIEVV